MVFPRSTLTDRSLRDLIDPLGDLGIDDIAQAAGSFVGRQQGSILVFRLRVRFKNRYFPSMSKQRSTFTHTLLRIVIVEEQVFLP